MKHTGGITGTMHVARIAIAAAAAASFFPNPVFELFPIVLDAASRKESILSAHPLRLQIK